MASQITNDNFSSADDSDVILRSTSHETQLKSRIDKVCKALRYLAFGCAIVFGICLAALYSTSFSSSNNRIYRMEAVLKIMKVLIPKNGNTENGVFFNLNQ